MRAAMRSSPTVTSAGFSSVADARLAEASAAEVITKSEYVPDEAFHASL